MREEKVEEMTFTMDLNVVLDKYYLPKVQAYTVLPGESASTFSDLILQEILADDEVLSSFKFTRFSNYKPNLYNCLEHFNTPAQLTQYHDYTRILKHIYCQEDFCLYQVPVLNSLRFKTYPKHS